MTARLRPPPPSPAGPWPPDTRESLPRTFFARPADAVAQDLLGCLLLSVVDGRLTGGRITETEAYGAAGAVDLASHGSRSGGRPTARNAAMFAAPGYAYVYFVYGMHWCFNISSDGEGVGGAVLIRALEPLLGLEDMARRRAARRGAALTEGPARICQALGIFGGHDGLDVCDPSAPLRICADERPPSARGRRISGARVGLGQVPEPWLSLPWRFREWPPERTPDRIYGHIAE